MSEATSNDHPMSASEKLTLIERLASLLSCDPRFAKLVQVPMDAMLTSEQAAEWMQCDVATLHQKVKLGILPAVDFSGHLRFHPRTILDQGHAHFFIRNNRKRKQDQ